MARYERNVMSFFSVLDLIRVNGKEASQNYSMLKEEMDKQKPDAERVRTLATQAMTNYLKIKDLSRKFEYRQINKVREIIHLLVAQHIREIGNAVNGSLLDEALKEALKDLKEERHEEKRLTKEKKPKKTLFGQLMRERKLTRKRAKKKKYGELINENRKFDDIHEKLLHALGSESTIIKDYERAMFTDFYKKLFIEYIDEFEQEFSEIFDIYTKDDFEEYKVLELLKNLQSHTDDEELKKTIEETLGQMHHQEEHDLRQSKLLYRQERRLVKKAEQELKSLHKEVPQRFSKGNCIVLLEKITHLRPGDYHKLDSYTFTKPFMANAQEFATRDLYVNTTSVPIETIIEFFNTAPHKIVLQLAIQGQNASIDDFANIVGFLNQHKSIAHVSEKDLVARLILLARSPFSNLERFHFLLDDNLTLDIMLGLRAILYTERDPNNHANLINKIGESEQQEFFERAVKLMQEDVERRARAIKNILTEFSCKDTTEILAAIEQSPRSGEILQVLSEGLPLERAFNHRYHGPEGKDKKPNLLTNLSLIEALITHLRVPPHELGDPYDEMRSMDKNLERLGIKNKRFLRLIGYALSGEDLIALYPLHKDDNFLEAIDTLEERKMLNVYHDLDARQVALLAYLAKKGVKPLAPALCFACNDGETAEQAGDVYVSLVKQGRTLGPYLPGDLVQLFENDDAPVYSIGIPITRDGYRLNPVEELQKAPGSIENIPASRLDRFVEDEDWRTVEKLREKNYLVLHAANAVDNSVSGDRMRHSLDSVMEYNLFKVPRIKPFSAHTLHPRTGGLYRTSNETFHNAGTGIIFDKGRISHAWNHDASTADSRDGQGNIDRNIAPGKPYIPELPVRLAIQGQKEVDRFKPWNELVLLDWHVEGAYFLVGDGTLQLSSERWSVLRMLVEHKVPLYLIDAQTHAWTAYYPRNGNYFSDASKSTGDVTYDQYEVSESAPALDNHPLVKKIVEKQLKNLFKDNLPKYKSLYAA